MQNYWVAERQIAFGEQTDGPRIQVHGGMKQLLLHESSAVWAKDCRKDDHRAAATGRRAVALVAVRLPYGENLFRLSS
jgi:hypothetical protein